MNREKLNAYQLLFASRANISLPQQEYMLIAVVSAIGNNLKRAVDLCEQKLEAESDESSYYEDRANIIYESDIYDEVAMNEELDLHEKSNENRLNNNFKVTSSFRERISEIFSEILDILFIKFLIDKDIYFIGKIIESDNLPATPFLAAAFSGLTADDFIESDCAELCDNLRRDNPEKSIYADAYENFYVDLRFIDGSLSGGIELLRIQKRLNDKFKQFVDLAALIESIITRPVEKSKWQLKLEMARLLPDNRHYDEDDLPF